MNSYPSTKNSKVKNVGTAPINNIPTRDILIGKMGNDKYLQAEFDEFVVYHRALNDSEVVELYGLKCDDFVSEEEVVADGGYRYGFNGKEKDDEVSGKGNQYDYGFRIYNPRLGRFLSTDPLFKSYPWYTPYQFAGNMPIWAIDLDGLEEKIVTDVGYLIEATYAVTQKVADEIDILKLQEVVNATLNGNPSKKLEGDLQKYLPNLMNSDGMKKESVPSEVRVQFKINVVLVTPEDVDLVDLSKSRISTKNGMSLGGTIEMGRADDPGFKPEKNGFLTSAYHKGEKIFLNPTFFDSQDENYHGYGTVDNGNGTTTTYNGNKYLTITHEVGHDMGLNHDPGVYPKSGNMSNQGDRVPTYTEIEIINDPNNESIIQPGKKHE